MCNKTNILVFYSFLLIATTHLFGCKTAEEIRREKLVDELAVQMTNNKGQLTNAQKITANLTTTLSSYESQLTQLNGKLEEQDHILNTDLKKRVENLESNLETSNQKLADLETLLKKYGQEQDKKNEEQSRYLKQVLQQLETLGGSSSTPSKKKSNFETALELFQNRYYTKARPYFVKTLEQKNIKSYTKERSLHNLGIIDYTHKKYNDALISFSKLITNNPESRYAPNSLLHIGKCLKELGKKEKAKEAFTQVLQKYPNSKRVSMAKELLKQLK